MSKLLVEDALWERVEPLLPTPKPRRFRYPGRKPLDNRAALTGILFILKTGLPWNDLPREMGCGSGAACWVRLHEWHKLGVWAALHTVLLAELRHADKIDWSRAAADSTTLRALRGGDKTGKTPTDRGRKGTKDHLLTDGNGVPLAAHATAATQQLDFNEAGFLRTRMLAGRGREHHVPVHFNEAGFLRTRMLHSTRVTVVSRMATSMRPGFFEPGCSMVAVAPSFIWALLQ